jgi:hypothetical protein
MWGCGDTLWCSPEERCEPGESGRWDEAEALEGDG